ncbi:MAG: phosphatase PAP2 family protein [Bryobacteraceae bacterium]
MLHFHIASYAYLASALTGSFAICLWARPGVRSLGGTLLLGAGFWALCGMLDGGPPLCTFPAFLGLGSLGTSALTALWSGPGQRQSSLDTCLTASMFPLFLVLAGFSLAVTSVVHPKTYDLFLYAFDEQLGGQPSFLIGRIFARSAALRQICYIGYEALPFAMAVAFAMERGRPGGHISRLMPAFAVAAAGGFLLYNLYPAAGPVHVFGTQFPYSPPPSGAPPFRMVAVDSAPRNAMPSVHIAMALLILWNSRPWPKLCRGLAGGLLAITILATLGFGEHYLVDLFVAVPFALLAQGLAVPDVPWRNAARAAAVAAGGLAVAAWLIYLRLPSPPLESNGALAWSLLAGSAVAALFLEARLHSAGAQTGLPAPGRVIEREYAARLRAPG